MNAKRTEYKGIVFDSKSEAVFAKTLDIAGHAWVYHPQPHCGHEWDFLVFPTHVKWSWPEAHVGGLLYERRVKTQTAGTPVLVEYKPSIPTMTYVEHLTEQMRPDPVESIVVWGNPWDGVTKTHLDRQCCYQVYPIFSSHNYKCGWGDFMPMADSGQDIPVSYRHVIFDVLDITEDMVQEAKQHRFDLLNA